MQIIKIYPNNKNKCDFSIRKQQNKYFVFEKDRALRTDLEALYLAETEINSIVFARKKNKLTKTKVVLEPKSCVVCKTTFVPSRKNHNCCDAVCSRKNYTNNQSFKEADPIVKESVLQEPINTHCVTELFEQPLSEVLNEFQEFTEKEMRLDFRKKKVDQFATDIVDYVFVWCELNMDKYFSLDNLFNELLNYKIVDLNKKTFINVFTSLLTYEDAGFKVSERFDFTNSESLFNLRNRLSETIFEENAIPTEEQYTKVAVIRLMTSQLRLFLYERNKLKQEKPQPISNAFDTAIFQGLLEMIQNLANQNKIIGENLEKCLEITQNQETNLREIAIAQVETNCSNKSEMIDLKFVLNSIREKVSEITQKRKGLFR
jgi:hypothetical protein